MQIRAEEISQIIRKEIESFDQKVSVMETGTVLEAGDGIARAYRDLADAHTGRVRARVTSAEPLTAAAADRVRRALEERTGKKVIVETAVDPSLIGGVVAQVGDLVLDGSVRTQLADLRSKLLN